MTANRPAASPAVPDVGDSGQRCRARPISTGSGRLSASLRRVLAAQFSADELRHLAALMDADTPGLRARRRLSDESVEELAAMIVAGKRPTVGWWRRAA